MKDLFDYDVYDRKDEKVGSVENYWANENNEIGFIGIRTGWLGLGQNHLVPTDEATIDESQRVVRLPYDEALIKSSPSFDSEGDLGSILETSVYSHFGLAGREHTHTGAATATSYDESIERINQPYQGTGTAAVTNDTTANDTVDIPLSEEKVRVDKRTKDLGEVRLRKVVRTETIHQPVEVRHEDVVVERVSRASDTGRTAADQPFTEQVVSIPVSEEEAVVDKTVESAGAVRARKIAETEHEDVTETVRKEDVEVDREYETTAHRD